ncbi:MAG: MCE family protein, partial [Planctomycetes bacterium]|nr:MCE family protein [Planctomycetota bacterium]
MTHDPVPPADGALPRARVVAARRRGFPLLLPLVAGAVALFLAIHAWMGGGPEITVRAAAGHGVGVGDPLRYRGVTVGEVRRVALAADREHVDLVLALEPGAESLCREQSRFWIVRPHLTLDSVQGLETVVGARYLAVLPGPLDGPERYDFDALAEPPVPVEVRAEGLELELEAASREGLVPGAEVRYRGVPVGTVLSADLAGDASSVVVRAYVEPEYAQLVRANSYFWSSGGLELRAGLTSGVRLELESLRALLVGGISFATPSDAGALATDGTRFVLHREPHEDAASWRPALLVGAEPLAPAAAELVALPVRLEWRSGLFKSRHERAGWAVALPGALLAPADLLAAPDDAKAGSVALTVDGARFELA